MRPNSAGDLILRGIQSQLDDVGPKAVDDVTKRSMSLLRDADKLVLLAAIVEGLAVLTAEVRAARLEAERRGEV